MSLLTSIGKEAIQKATTGGADTKDIIIRPKEGEVRTVRIMSIEDSAGYEAVTGFKTSVYTQPSKVPLGEVDYNVEAYKLAEAGKAPEIFTELKPKTRFLVGLVDLDTMKKHLWDCTYTQYQKFLEDTKDYVKMLGSETFERGVLFKFKRTGKGTSTVYSFAPVIDLDEKDKYQTKWEDCKGITFEPEFFESVLQPRKSGLQCYILEEAGFDVKKHFPEMVEEVAQVRKEIEEATNKKSTSEKDPTNPLDTF